MNYYPALTPPTTDSRAGGGAEGVAGARHGGLVAGPPRGHPRPRGASPARVRGRPARRRDLPRRAVPPDRALGPIYGIYGAVYIICWWSC